jgi:hypothetical protein
MALAQEDIEFIKDHLGDWLAERSLGKPPAVYEIELRERMVRVEEELRHQRELMREGFAQMETGTRCASSATRRPNSGGASSTVRKPCAWRAQAPTSVTCSKHRVRARPFPPITLPGCHEQVARPLRLARCNGGDGLRERVLFARHFNDQGFHGLPSSSGCRGRSR